jgi:hypothetical protein
MNSQPYFLQSSSSFSTGSDICWQNLIIFAFAIIIIKFIFFKPRRNNQERDLIRQLLRQNQYQQQYREGFAPTLPSIQANPSTVSSKSPISDALPFTSKNSDELIQNDPVIVPPVYDPTSKSVMSGIGIQRPQLESPWGTIYNKSKLQSKYYLDDGAQGTAGLNFNLCSKSCCSQQWPTPFKLKYDPLTCANKDKFTPSNYMCNNAWQDSGCVCLRKGQAKNLMDRGGNA